MNGTKVIFWLSARNMMKNKRKYLAALLAVVLTSLLFSAVVSLGYMMVQSINETQFHSRGDRSMATLRFILPEQYEKLKDDKMIKSASYSQIVSVVEQDGVVMEVRYGEDEFAQNMYSYPTTGEMPKEKMEFAASIQELELLGAKAKVGEKVELSFPIGEEVYTDIFTISGYWDAESEDTYKHQQCWVSRELCNDIIKSPKVAVNEQDEIAYTGYYMMDIDFHNSRNIEQKVLKLLQQNGYAPDEIVCQVNEAYLLQETAGGIGIVLVMCCLLMLVGYLLIYNIFHIRITLDTRYYALLSAVGMDEKQLGLTVKTEAFLLTMVGAPIGIFLGRMIAYFLVPFAAEFLAFELVMERHVKWWIYLLIFVFAGVTVYLSCRKSMRIVQKVALTTGMEYQGNIRRYHKSKDDVRLRVRKLAVWNIMREKGKLWTVVAAVSFAVVLFNSIYSLVGGFSLEKYMLSRIDSDYIITDQTILNTELEKVLDGVTDEFIGQLEQVEGLKDFRYTYMFEGYVALDAITCERVEQMAAEYGTDYVLDELETGKMSCQVYGLEEEDAADIIFEEGSWDAGRFASGKYVIVNKSLQGEEAFYHVGENVTVQYPDGTENVYEVLGVGEVPYVVGSRYWSNMGCRVILPKTEYLKHADDTGAMLLRCNRNEEYEAFSESMMSELIRDAGLTYVSRDDYMKEFADFKNAYLLIGGMLAGVIGFIGLLNFANTIVTSVSYRERELTILNVIGMTERQCRQMLLWEGFYYAMLSNLFTDTIGVLVSYCLVKVMASMYEFVDWNFNVWPVIGGNVLFLVIACMATMLTYRLMGKKEVGLRLQKFN